MAATNSAGPSNRRLTTAAKTNSTNGTTSTTSVSARISPDIGARRNSVTAADAGGQGTTRKWAAPGVVASALGLGGRRDDLAPECRTSLRLRFHAVHCRSFLASLGPHRVCVGKIFP